MFAPEGIFWFLLVFVSLIKFNVQCSQNPTTHDVNEDRNTIMHDLDLKLCFQNVSKSKSIAAF